MSGYKAERLDIGREQVVWVISNGFHSLGVFYPSQEAAEAAMEHYGLGKA